MNFQEAPSATKLLDAKAVRRSVQEDPFPASYILQFSGFRRGVNEICALVEFYAASVGSLLSLFRDNMSIPSSVIRQSSWTA